MCALGFTNWANISDVTLLSPCGSARNGSGFFALELLRERITHTGSRVTDRAIRIVDGTIVKKTCQTGSQWWFLHRSADLTLVTLPASLIRCFEAPVTLFRTNLRACLGYLAQENPHDARRSQTVGIGIAPEALETLGAVPQ